MGKEVFNKEEISSDLDKRLKRQQSTPYSKIEMNRKIIHQLVRDRFKSVINFILEDAGIEASIEELGDDYFINMVKAFVPFFDICALCKFDKHCPIQSIVIESTHNLYTKLQQLQPPVDIAPNHTITKCGMFDLIEPTKIMTGYIGVNPTRE